MTAHIPQAATPTVHTGQVDRYRVAAVQFEPILGAKWENIGRLLALTETAAAGGAQLITLPEMATTGYCWYNRDEIRPYVEPIPGPTTEAFTIIARQYNTYIVVGMAEVGLGTGFFYNSAVLIGPAGVVGVYRKTHSFAADLHWAKDGDLGLPVWQTPLGRIGIMICMDAGYFEPARLLALAGADVVCFPTNWLGEKSPSAAWTARAFENGCYLIVANRYGSERGVQFSGGSCVLNPDGTIQAFQETEDGIVYGEVSLTGARKKSFGPHGPSEKLTTRRPELYDNLTINRYLWNPTEFHSLYGHRPLPPGRRSLVAVVQTVPHHGDPAANVAVIKQTLEQLHIPTTYHERLEASRIDLVVFPEYALTGCPSGDRTNPALTDAEAATWHDQLIELACRYALHLIIGYAEQSCERTFSTAVLIGPAGIVTRYRKTHVVGDDVAWCCPGMDKPPVVDLPLGRLGLLIGTDLCFPEVPRHLALEGCDLLVVPAGPGLPPPIDLAQAALSPASSDGATSASGHLLLARQRARENNCYLAFASAPHPHGIGHSAIFGPGPAYAGCETVLGSHEAGVAVGTVDTGSLDTTPAMVATVRTKELVRKRQTYLYDALQMVNDRPT
ncbi:MAG: amidohydrolase [Herpetosiphon sp.]